jgi:hypothetical protein
MPLDRNNITIASRIMLPSYVVFFATIGINFIVAGKPRLVSSPMIRYANNLMTIRAWGAFFLTCAVIMLAALLVHNRYLYRYGLMVCIMSMMIWTSVAFAGIFTEPVSYAASAWPAFVAVACWASNKSLEKGERDPRREY